MGLVAVWGEPVDVEGLCLDSVRKDDRFCLVWGEGVKPDVEFYKGLLECGGRATSLVVSVRIVLVSVVSSVDCV